MKLHEKLDAIASMDLDGIATAVLMTLARYSNDKGVAWPSVATICEDCHFGRTAVLAALGRLAESGAIKKSGERSRRAYTIPILSPSGEQPKSARRPTIVRETDYLSPPDGPPSELPIELPIELPKEQVRASAPEPDQLTLTPDEPKPPTEDDQIREVLEYWRDKTGRTSRCNIGKGTKRWSRVRARVRQGFTVSALKTAVRGAMLDEWYSSRGLLEVSNIFRDEERVERFVNVVAAQRAKRDRERAEREYQEAMAQPASPDSMVLDFLKEMASK